MNAQELRIGNLVADEFYDSFKTIIKIDSINDKGVNLNIEDDGNWPELAQHSIVPEYAFDNLRGIPITEEWLVRFGFKETYRSVYQIKYDLSGQEQFGYDFGLVGDINGMRRLRYYGSYIKCEHVHRMQNIIHALTGQELTYNPK